MIDRKQAIAAPEFSAGDSEGHTVRLKDYRGKKNVLLVLNRGFS